MAGADLKPFSRRLVFDLIVDNIHKNWRMVAEPAHGKLANGTLIGSKGFLQTKHERHLKLM